MLRKDYKGYKTIQTKSPDEFDALLKEFIDSILLKNPEVKRFYDPTAGHIAYVEWEEHVLEPESIKDEFELKGIKYCCGECPFYVLQKDKRIKYSLCNKNERVWYEKSACDELYQMIQEGKVEL